MTTTCTVCGRGLEPELLPFATQPFNPPVTRLLLERQPDWQPGQPVCPECAYTAAHQALAELSAYSLQDELQLPYPVYRRDELGLLPTPRRVHAHPHYTGRGVTVAVLDSGFYPHPDLTKPHNRVLCHVDATSADPQEVSNYRRLHDTSWHGQMVACVGFGNGYMSDGFYAGVAPEARLVLVKTGSHRTRRISDRDILRALRWVIANHHRFDIRVINISLGGDDPTDGHPTMLDDAVEEAVRLGLTVVAAAGNEGKRELMSPAAAASAITVGGVNDQNSLQSQHRRMFWSNYGPGVHRVPKPDILAPAVWLAAPMLPKTWIHNEAQYLFRILAMDDAELRAYLGTRAAHEHFTKKTMELPLWGIRRVIRQRMIEQKYIHPHYQHVDGTSMAAPIVSGVVAQMLQANPHLTPADIKAILRDTAEKLPGVPDEKQGPGLMHAGRAVTAALRAAYGVWPPFSPQLTLTFYYFDPHAKQVALLGNFNGWQTRQHPMRPASPGLWEITIPATQRGEYAYQFLVDGDRLTHDPENPHRLEDGRGGFFSVALVGNN